MRSLWARITGADKSDGGELPLQQIVSLGRVGDATIIFPYGYYADLPNDTLLFMIAPGVAIPCNIQNPDESERGEPTFFHPSTKTRIIARDGGSLDIDTTDAGGNVNINTVQANVTASDSVNIDAPETNLGVGGPAIARVGDTVQVTVTSGSSAGTYNGTITSGGDNTSI